MIEALKKIEADLSWDAVASICGAFVVKQIFPNWVLEGVRLNRRAAKCYFDRCLRNF